MVILKENTFPLDIGIKDLYDEMEVKSYNDLLDDESLIER
jgi:hypothetical protein